MQSLRIEENVPLAPFTTFYIGGPARYFVCAGSIDELQEALEFAKKDSPAAGLKVLILGGGSNILMSEAGFDGLVIKIEIQGIEVQRDVEKKKEKEIENKEQESKKVILIAGAGESWDTVVAQSVQKNLWGLENLSGIPGTVGGAVVQNIGAYGAAVSEVLQWVEVFDAKSKKKGNEAVKRMSAQECLFDYRDSVFKHTGEYIVTRAAFALSQEVKPNLSYKDLAEKFSYKGQLVSVVQETQETKTQNQKEKAPVPAPTLEAIREAILAIRKAKFPDVNVEGTAGSFFKNPILSKLEAEALKAKYPEMPLFAMPETEGVKIPLAWILDKVLHLKSFSVGGARLFEKQPLVIATSRSANAHDVLELQKIVTEKVFTEAKIKIEPEVKIIL